MKSIWLTLLAIGLFLVGTAVVLSLPDAQSQALSQEELSAMPIVVEYAAPELALVDLDGRDSSLEDYRGQVVLVNNWATWCPPCKAEMPTLQAFYETYADDGFVIIAIEAGEPAEEVASFARQYELTFPVWVDPGGDSMHAFGNFNLPNSYVIDRDGIVRLMWTGAVSRAVLEKYVAPFIQE